MEWTRLPGPCFASFTSGGEVFRFFGSLLSSPAGRRGKPSILSYHRALAAPDPILHDEIHAATA